MMRKFLVLFFAIILIGCNSSLLKTKEPIIQFETPNIPEQIQNGYRFDLNVEIFAVDENLLFLFGSIGEFSDHPLQSIILRSENSGQHWQEVMKPERTSQVLDLQILDSGKGWALIQLQNESANVVVTLFQTTNFGKSWEKLSEIPKNASIGFPSFMHFANEQDGQIDITYPHESPSYLVHLSTYDGGQTWIETGSYYPKFDNLLSQSNITEAYVHYTNKDSQSLSLDRRSLWKLSNTNDEIIIYRKLPKPENDASGFVTWQDWETITTLPLQLNYQNGMILLP